MYGGLSATISVPKWSRLVHWLLAIRLHRSYGWPGGSLGIDLEVADALEISGSWFGVLRTRTARKIVTFIAALPEIHTDLSVRSTIGVITLARMPTIVPTTSVWIITVSLFILAFRVAILKALSATITHRRYLTFVTRYVEGE